VKRLLKAALGYKFYLKDYLSIRKELKKAKRDDKVEILPCVFERTATTWFDTHYVYHPAWALRIVKKVNPSSHIDISSTLHFCSALSAFYPVKFYDYRPANIRLDNLETGFADLCNLHFEDDSVQSLSCMHTVEHIGLGRYGDPIDINGDGIAIKELQRVVAPGGHLLFVTPVGKPKIMFNAHRIYSYNQIVTLFNKMELVEFSMVPDDGLETGIIFNAAPELVEEQDYACGCFWFKKK
jgi:SAM-dependent methyltransferase